MSESNICTSPPNKSITSLNIRIELGKFYKNCSCREERHVVKNVNVIKR